MSTMSIREGSAECSVSPLELFDVPPTQTAVEKSYDVEFLPTSALRESGVVEFYLPASSEDYLDLKNSRLYVRARIVRSDGTACGQNERVAPTNNLLQTMWSNVELLVNERLVTHSNNVHGYVSMLSHLMHDSDEMLGSERQMQMVYKDTAGSLDETNCKMPNPDGLIAGLSYRWQTRGELAENPAAGDEEPDYSLTLEDQVVAIAADTPVGNGGLHRRHITTCNSQPFEMMGNIRLDLMQQLRYLPNGLAIKLRLHQQKGSFSLMCPQQQPDNEQRRYKLELLNACFIARRIKPSTGVLLGHADALAKKPAEFPIVRKECKSFAIPAGIMQFKQDNIFLGQLPTRVVIAMVRGAAFAGSFQHNPFLFNHYNASLVQVYADGEPVRSRPFRPNVADGQFVECYNSLYREFGKVDGDRGSIIKLEDWTRGYSLFAFSLSPDTNCDDHTSLVKHGNLRVEVQFSEALEHAIQLLVYAEFDNVIKIDSNRQLMIDYV